MVPSYQQAARSPLAWQHVARDLVCAANVVRLAMEQRLLEKANLGSHRAGHALWRPLLNLYGAAAENLLKAILVGKGVDPFANGRLTDAFKTHNLLKLAQKVHLPIGHHHEHFLKRLQEFVEVGKYPVGTSEGSGRGSFVFSSYEVNDALQLLQYLEDELRSTAPSAALPEVDLRTLCEK